MITSTQNRATLLGRVLALGFLLATLLAMLLSAAPADAAAPSGKAFGWGNNGYGQLGNGNTGTDSDVPVAVQNLTDLKSVKAGCYHGLALKNDGTLYAWGFGGNGQLGNADNASTNVPVKVQNLSNVKAISASCTHNLALKEDGTVWAWGYNGNGQLGNGTNDSSNVPVKVGSLGTDAKGIAAGYDFSLALMKDGTVKSWGNNFYGELGNGTSGAGTERNTPGPVSNLTGVKAIATNSIGGHVLALLNNGTVDSWGDNRYGQLGNGASGPGRNTPGPVSNLTGVKTIATGGYHSLALLKSGNVKSWGYNGEGELGNGTHGVGADRSTPTDVIGLTNVRSVSGGTYHSLAVLKSGKVKSWGYNYYGELGNGANGDDTESDVPINVENLTNVKNIDGGDEFTLAATE